MKYNNKINDVIKDIKECIEVSRVNYHQKYNLTDNFIKKIENIFVNNPDAMFYVHATPYFSDCYRILKNGLFINASDYWLNREDFDSIHQYILLSKTCSPVFNYADIIDWDWVSKSGYVVIIEQPSLNKQIVRKVKTEDHEVFNPIRKVTKKAYQVIIDKKYIKAIIDKNKNVVITNTSLELDEYFKTLEEDELKNKIHQEEKMNQLSQKCNQKTKKKHR